MNALECLEEHFYVNMKRKSSASIFRELRQGKILLKALWLAEEGQNPKGLHRKKSDVAPPGKHMRTLRRKMAIR